MPFRFHDLPPLVQCKILRQYVPVYTKASVLSHMSEFRDILHYNESWQHSFAKGPEKYPSVPSLKPGIYICDDEWWRSFYIVSNDAESISFAFYSASFLLKTYSCFYNAENDWETTLEMTLSDMQKFLSKFLEGHSFWNERNVNYFSISSDQLFVVNHVKKKLFWKNGTMHSIRRNGKCYLKWGPKRYTELVVGKNYKVDIRPYGYHYRHHTGAHSLTLRPEPLNAYMKSSNFNFKLTFKMQQHGSIFIDFLVDFQKLSPYQCFFFQIPLFKIAIDDLKEEVWKHDLENLLRDDEDSFDSSD